MAINNHKRGEILKIALVGRNAQRTLRRSLVMAIVLVAFFTQVLLPTRIVGGSMEPTIRNGSWRVIFLLRYCRRQPQRGDIVCIRLAGRHVSYAKRILARTGDRIAFASGTLILNGQVINEPYVSLTGGDWHLEEVIIGENEWFVAGDNRSMPQEQHTAGIITTDRIIGALL